MNNEMQTQILQRIDGLAAKLGVAAQYLFALYVRQAKIDGYECLVGCVLAAVAFVVCALFAAKDFRKPRDAYQDPMLGVLLTFAAVGSLVAFLVCGFNGFDLVV